MATVVAGTDAAASGDAAWMQLHALRERARADRAGALSTLRELFASGRASAGIDGPAEGRFVAFTVQPAADRALGALAGLWMPWSGKRFDAAAGSGENLLLNARLSALGFATRVEPAALDPAREVLVIDYAAVPSNRWVGMSRVRDELVEIAPGVHLGQALWRRAGGRHTRIAWWALRAS